MSWDAENEFLNENAPFLDADGFHYGLDWELLTNFDKKEIAIYNDLHQKFSDITKIHPSAYDASGSLLPNHKAFLVKNDISHQKIWETLGKIRNLHKKIS